MEAEWDQGWHREGADQERARESGRELTVRSEAKGSLSAGPQPRAGMSHSFPSLRPCRKAKPGWAGPPWRPHPAPPRAAPPPTWPPPGGAAPPLPPARPAWPASAVRPCGKQPRGRRPQHQTLRRQDRGPSASPLPAPPPGKSEACFGLVWNP